MSTSTAAWPLLPLKTRLVWVARYRRLLAASESTLCALLQEELHRPRHESVTMEILPLLASCKWLERVAPRLLSHRELAGRPAWLSGGAAVEQRVPLGKVAIIATWTSPVHHLGVQLVQALVAGNTVMVKPSERCPKTHARLLEMAVEAGLPAGVLSWTGATREAGANMLATQQFDHVLFTGSAEVGQRVTQALAKSMTPVTLCVGGRDSALVLEDADAKRAARAVFGAICSNSGQSCTTPRRVLVVGKAYDKFVREMIALGSMAQERTLIDEAASQRCKELVSQSLGKGARDAGMLTPTPPKVAINIPSAEVNNRFRPTVLVDCTPTMDVVNGDHQGPLVAVVPCKNLSEALAIHRRCDDHAGASIFCKDKHGAWTIAGQLGVAHVAINDIHTQGAHPAIAVGAAGRGSTRGEEGLLTLTRAVTVVRGSHAIARAAMPAPLWKQQWTVRLMQWWYEARKARRLDLGKVHATGVTTLPSLEHESSAKGTTMGVTSGAGSGIMSSSDAPLSREGTVRTIRPAAPNAHARAAFVRAEREADAA